MPKKYKLVGHSSPNPNEDFSFVLPIYSWNKQLFTAIIDKKNGSIQEFVEQRGCHELKAMEDIECSVGDEGIYIFIHRSRLWQGHKIKIILSLYKLVREESFNYLQLYDIYFFAGDHTRMNEVLGKFITENSLLGLSLNNFLTPPSIKVGLADFAKSMMVPASLLDYRKAALPFDNMFRRNAAGAISYLTYTIDVKELQGGFHQLIDYYSSPVYKDLVVHCFIQNKLDDSIVKANPAYRLRKLFPIKPVDFKTPELNDDLYQNSQSVRMMGFNTLELSNALTKEIGNAEETDKEVSKETADGYYKLINKIKQDTP